MTTINKYWLIFIFILFLNSCGNNYDSIELEKEDYYGNELMMSGYFIDGQDGEHRGLLTTYIFYRDGTAIYGGSYPKDEYSIQDIEDNFKSDSFEDGIKKSRLGWGIFNINDNSLEFELWTAGNGKKKTVVRTAKILDQYTFVVTKFYNNYSGGTSVAKDTFYFKELVPKPDSTNTYLE